MNRHHCMLLMFMAVALCSTSCGGLVTVKGVVTLDGAPVEGATVSFVTGDGKHTYTGLTDAGGNFTLLSADQKPGVAAGTYKVTVVKTPAMKMGPTEPGSPEYMKEMQNEQKEGAKFSKPKIGMPPGMPGMAKSGAAKSELPVVYATVGTTPLTAKVPPDTNPIAIELKSKP